MQLLSLLLSVIPFLINITFLQPYVYCNISVNLKSTSALSKATGDPLLPPPPPLQKHEGYVDQRASVEVKGQCKIYESQVINNGNAIYNATRVAIVDDDVCYSCCSCLLLLL